MKTNLSFQSFIGWVIQYNTTRVVAVLLFFLFSVTTSLASHYRYGSISYKVLGPVSADSCEIEVTVTQAWEMCEIVCHFPVPPSIGDPSPVTSTLVLETAGGSFVSSEGIVITVTSVNLAEETYYGTYTTTMTVLCDSAYLLFYEDCCRILEIANNSSFSFRSETVVTPPGGGNSSPIATLPPVVKLPKGPMSMFPIPATDPDSDPLFFRLATPEEAVSAGAPAGGNPIGFSVSPTGMATFITGPIPPLDTLHNAFIAIEDTAGSKIIVDFIIQLVDSSIAPMFDFGVTPHPAPCLTYYVGDTVKITVKAFDPEPGDIVKIAAVGVPLGATFSPTLPTPGGNPDSTEMTWILGPGDVGVKVITFDASDTLGVTTLTSVCISVIDTTPPPGGGTMDSCVSDASWMLSTVTTVATANSYPWPGVGSYPSLATFTDPVVVGQPYPWEHLYTVPGSDVISALSGVTYYLKTFELADHTDVNTRIRMFMDDDVEIFINGHWLALEDGMGKVNWRTVNHDILFKDDGTVDNGHMLGDPFDYHATPDMDTVLKTGMNTLVLAIRNRTSKPDKGGFSFRMDMDKGGMPVLKKAPMIGGGLLADESGVITIYPNPASNWVNVVIDEKTNIIDNNILLLDLNGKVIQSYDLQSHEAQLNLDALASGVYIIRVVSDSGAHSSKVFKF